MPAACLRPARPAAPHTGGETDLDLGNYERFIDVNLTKNNSITTGNVYKHVIDMEREGPCCENRHPRAARARKRSVAATCQNGISHPSCRRVLGQDRASDPAHYERNHSPHTISGPRRTLQHSSASA